MKSMKRASTVAGALALFILAPALCWASAKYSTTRNIVAGDVITMTVKRNTSALTRGQGQVLDTSGGIQLLVAFLAAGTTTANTVSVTGLTANGNPATNCSKQVSGPLPKDPLGVECTGAVTYLTVVTSPE